MKTLDGAMALLASTSSHTILLYFKPKVECVCSVSYKMKHIVVFGCTKFCKRVLTRQELDHIR